eukprot:gene12009-16077_t
MNSSNEEEILCIDLQLDEINIYLKDSKLTGDEKERAVTLKSELVELKSVLTDRSEALKTQKHYADLFDTEKSDSIYAISIREPSNAPFHHVVPTPTDEAIMMNISNILENNVKLEEKKDLNYTVPMKATYGNGCGSSNFVESDSIKEDNKKFKPRTFHQDFNKSEPMKVGIKEFTQSKLEECNSCFEFVEKLWDLSCGHKFCVECLNKLYSMAIKDRSLIPVKCCKIKLDDTIAGQVLTGQELFKYRTLKSEQEMTDKMYCSNKNCSILIDFSAMAIFGVFHTTNSIKCPNPKCSVTICMKCKASHNGETCEEYTSKPLDERMTEDDRHLIAALKNDGLARCNQCQRFVELTIGCHHMTCACTYEFCYKCEKKWHTCRCDLWEEGRLTAAAEQRVPLQERGNHIAVQNARGQILREEQCAHSNWRNITRGNGKCSNCNFITYAYHFRCHNCHLAVCNTCRYHRL